MLNKYFLINKISKFLLKKNFKIFFTEGSFDIAARKEKLFLLKILLNIDALQKDQAKTLIAVSHFVSAYPLVISEKNNKNKLSSGIVYSRFDLPVVNFKTFQNVMENEAELIYASKGKYTVKIDSEKLRFERQNLGYSLSELSRIIGVSKKTLYEIENKKVNPSKTTLYKLENFFNTDLALPFILNVPNKFKLYPKNPNQKSIFKEFMRIGLDCSASYHTLFEIIGKSREPFITRMFEDSNKANIFAKSFRKISSVFSSKAFFITKSKTEEIIGGIPVISEKELLEIETVKDFNKVLEEKIA